MSESRRKEELVIVNEYNGWKSYETWKVMSDWFGDMNLEEHQSLIGESPDDMVSYLCRCYVEDMLGDDAKGYILESFLNCVSWGCVAEAVIYNLEEMLEYED